MSWMTIIWSMLASASTLIGLMHFSLWRRNVSSDYYLFSSLMALAAGAAALTELALAKAHSPASLAVILRLSNVFIGVTVVTMTWFLHRYLGTGKRFLLWAITGLWSCGLVVNFISPWSLTFAEVTGVQEMVTFWGEPYNLILGSGNPFKILAELASLLIAVFVVDATIQAWRSGRKRQAGITGGAISFFIIAAGIHTPLVDAGIVKTPYMISVAFVAIVAALNYEMARDVSNTLRQTREIAAGHQRWRSLLASVQLAVVDLDPAGTIRYANPFFLDRTGYDSGEIQDRHFADLIPSDLRGSFLQRLQQGLKGIPRPSSRWPVRTATGPVLTFDWTSVGLRTVDGVPDGVLSIGADVTDQISTKHELEQTRRDLDRVNRANVLGEFVSAIAHELSQPLAAILSNAHVARRYLDSTNDRREETREILELIISDDKRAATVIERLRAMLIRGEVTREEFALDAALSEVLELLEADIRAEGIDLQVDLASDLPLVMAGRVEIQQVLLNLLQNAVAILANPLPRPKRILVSTERKENDIWIMVQDSGPGLTTEQKDDIFTAFVTKNTNGMGMGLTICRRIIEGHRGSILAGTGTLEGACFRFSLPLASDKENHGAG
jgi:two-component system sensor kinase FixL